MIAALALSLSAGHGAIAAHEHAYWKGSGVPYRIARCRRRSVRQVSCRVTVPEESGSLSWLDIATRRRDGRVRVTETAGRLVLDVSQ
jgi:hypothetical protein